MAEELNYVELDLLNQPVLSEADEKLWNAFMCKGLGERDFLELSVFVPDFVKIARYIGYLRALEAIEEIEEDLFEVERFLVFPPHPVPTRHSSLEKARIHALAEVSKWQIQEVEIARKHYGFGGEGISEAGEAPTVDPPTESDG